MPVFTFEKILPPPRSVPPAPAAEKPRSVIVQILDRFTEARTKRMVAKRTLIDEKAARAPRRNQSK